MKGRARSFAVGLALLSQTALGAKPAPTPGAHEIHAKLAAVLRVGLKGEVGQEAQRLDAAALALEKSGSQDGATQLVSDYQRWLTHLTSRETALRGGAAATGGQDAAARAHAAEMLPALEEKVKRILGHMEADTSPRYAVERAAVVSDLKASLAVVPKGDAVRSVLALHAAMAHAHGLLEKRTKELDEEQEHLSKLIAEEEAGTLYSMLKQRRMLPMTSQMGLLRRKQFENCTYAKQLEQSKDSSIPLFQQLEKILPQAWVQQFLSKDKKSTKVDHLAVRGSAGMVHVVSSRMKESVQKMAGVLRDARGKLGKLVAHPPSSISEQDVQQAKVIVAGLDKVLDNVSKTHDLKTQMDAMDEVQQSITKWMQAAASRQH